MQQKVKRVRATVVVVDDGRLLGYYGDDPASGQRYFFLPGGAIEPGESPTQCAERETLEETGYRIQIRPATETIARYDFAWSQKIYDCETYFFRGDLLDATPSPVNDASYHRGVCWIEIAAVDKALSYCDTIRAAVTKLLRSR